MISLLNYFAGIGTKINLRRKTSSNLMKITF